MGNTRSLDPTLLLPAAPRFVSARGRVESWIDAPVAAAVMQRWSAQMQPLYPPGAYAVMSPGIGGGEGFVGGIETWTEHVWVSAPARSRLEGRDAQGRAYQIVVGAQAWAEHTPFGQHIGWELSPDPVHRMLNPMHREAALALLEPWRLVHSYDLQAAGESEVAGHRGLRVIGTPTYNAWTVYESGGDDEPFVFVGAESAEFTIDADWGVLLHWAGFSDGSQYSSSTFTALAFDEALDDSLFDPAIAPQDRA